MMQYYYFFSALFAQMIAVMFCYEETTVQIAHQYEQKVFGYKR